MSGVRALAAFRPVRVVGIGLHRYQPASDATYVELGLPAIRDALKDSSLPWAAVQSAYVATAKLGNAGGCALLRHLGATGLPIVHVENASASGSSAFRLACQEVAAGFVDVALVVGVDKPNSEIPKAFEFSGIPEPGADLIVPFTKFALLTDQYMQRYKLAVDKLATVAVKNHRNGAMNPYAHRQRIRTVDEVLAGTAVSGVLTPLMCTPIGEGAAAVLIASEDAIRRYGLDASRAVRVASSVALSERPCSGGLNYDEEMTREATAQALIQAGCKALDLDVVELHDAFAIEEIQYVEAMGLCAAGQGGDWIANGNADINGACAVSASGGLIAMGHPIGPTGVGQVAEVVRQLRHEAGSRQHHNAGIGLAHMVGLGAVCVVHVLRRD
jgi:acetyl-CoA acetyltransferase